MYCMVVRLLRNSTKRKGVSIYVNCCEHVANVAGEHDANVVDYYQKNRSANVEKILDPALFQL